MHQVVLCDYLLNINQLENKNKITEVKIYSTHTNELRFVDCKCEANDYKSCVKFIKNRQFSVNSLSLHTVS